MKIATWNINGVKARSDGLATWLKEFSPDIVCLQEIKSQDATFPGGSFESLGYNVVTHGQKSFNGVAVFSKFPIESHTSGLPGDKSDEQARYLEAMFTTPHGPLCVVSLYLPNGNPIETEKFDYKLKWMDRLELQLKTLMRHEYALVVAGDYNVILQPEDAKKPEAWKNDALFQPQSRTRFQRLLNLGFTDAVRAVYPEPGVYTFWDYQGGSWQKNNGIRIDHILLSPQAVDRMGEAGIDKQTRGWEKPSDHVPVWVGLDLD